MKLDQNQARFLIAAKCFLEKEKMARPEINIFDHEVPKVEIVNISKLTEAEAEDVAGSLNKCGLIHAQIAGGKFDCCKVASLSFDILDNFLEERGKRC